ncbi:acyl-CoA thioesterase [Truncatella angustata]|uniref:Acyl-CoA thioesterase n=1 Tax=Truncatella angustata TaxID=152316 RepID=A0A9P8UC68_9PEZI|nr:acyl-CoA thioesterase [Truncatella angustata]KAH6647012.1 acyl-CoA thioesterase [Truncatella angustata]
MAGRATLIKAPDVDPSKAQIENALELTDLSIIGPDIFTNTRELWHPPGARGIYGGAVIAQTLAAAQRTVPADFVVHSYHCYFVLAGDSSVPILYHVERVREGRSFCTRTVQARQRGKAIFTVTMSFTKDNSGGREQVSHAAAMPSGVKPPPDDYEEDFGNGTSPFESYRIEVTNKDGPPENKKSRHWVRARGKISEAGGHQAHLSALAYVSDSYFIGTVSRIHRLWRFPFKADDINTLSPEVKEHVIKLNDFEGSGTVESMKGQPEIGMMVSLDHVIYFHNPKKVRADEWMFSEMESPWSGDGRGVVTQRIFSKDGTLLATCHQEVWFLSS